MYVEFEQLQQKQCYIGMSTRPLSLSPGCEYFVGCKDGFRRKTKLERMEDTWTMCTARKSNNNVMSYPEI